MNTVLEAFDLNTFYDRSHILFDVSFNIAAGETVCLMGRNGVGKTTTFRSLMGLTPPKTGKIVFQGKTCTGFKPFRMARLGLGFVPEDRRILGPFTVQENLELGRIPGRTGHWDLDSVYRQFPILADMTHRMGGTLSGGEQQMLTIARTLMGNPEIVLLDEPSEGLAPKILDQMVATIRELKAQGLTLLLSEQNLRFARMIADRVVVIETGHVRWVGTMDAFGKDREAQNRYLAA